MYLLKSLCFCPSGLRSGLLVFFFFFFFFDSVSPFESIPSLSIDASGVLSQLRRLNPNKAHGPDELDC